MDLLVNISNHNLSNFLNLIDFAESLFGRKVDIITEGKRRLFFPRCVATIGDLVANVIGLAFNPS